MNDPNVTTRPGGVMITTKNGTIYEISIWNDSITVFLHNGLGFMVVKNARYEGIGNTTMVNLSPETKNMPVDIHRRQPNTPPEGEE